MQLNASCYKDIWALSTYTSKNNFQKNLVKESISNLCSKQNYSTPSSKDRQELFFFFLNEKSELSYNIHHGYTSWEILQKSPSIQIGFVQKEVFLFFMSGILLRLLCFFHSEQRINNIPACPSVGKSSFQPRYTMMIDEAVGPTVAGRAAWQEFSVIERNLKYLFHLLY